MLEVQRWQDIFSSQSEDYSIGGFVRLGSEFAGINTLTSLIARILQNHRRVELAGRRLGGEVNRVV
jgi:hypothetical protein